MCTLSLARRAAQDGSLVARNPTACRPRSKNCAASRSFSAELEVDGSRFSFASPTPTTMNTCISFLLWRPRQLALAAAAAGDGRRALARVDARARRGGRHAPKVLAAAAGERSVRTRAPRRRNRGRWRHPTRARAPDLVSHSASLGLRDQSESPGATVNSS